MANLTIASTELVQAGTLTASHEESTMPASNLQTDPPDENWRSTNLTSNIMLDLGSAQPINLVSLIGTNAQSGDTVRVRAANTEADLTSSPGLDTGAVSLWIESDLSDWEYRTWYRYFSAAQNYRWWRLDIDASSNTDGFFDAGGLIVDSAYTPDINVQYGFSVQLLDPSQRATMIGGQLRALSRPVRRRFDMTYQFQSEADLYDGLFKLQRKRGTAKSVLAIKDPEATNFAHDTAAYGLLTNLRPIVHQSFNLFEAQMSVEEQIV